VSVAAEDAAKKGSGTRATESGGGEEVSRVPDPFFAAARGHGREGYSADGRETA
jgi:hypothetical protein